MVWNLLNKIKSWNVFSCDFEFIIWNKLLTNLVSCTRTPIFFGLFEPFEPFIIILFSIRDWNMDIINFSEWVELFIQQRIIIVPPEILHMRYRIQKY